MNNIKTSLLAISLTILSACTSAPTQEPQSDLTKAISYGFIATPNVSIDEASGAFTYRSDDRFTPGNQDKGIYYRGKDFQTVMGHDLSKMIDRYNTALKHGAHKVYVHVPFFKERLYGVLYFSEAPLTAKGPAARSYRIEIPRSYAEAALGGRISVVYEPVNYTWHSYVANTEISDETVTWALWLSDMPFADGME